MTGPMGEIPRQGHADFDGRLQQPFREAMRASGSGLVIVFVLEL